MMWPRRRQPALVRSRVDPEAFVEVHDEFAPALLRFFAIRVSDPQVAVDLMADTLATVYEHRDRFRGSSADEASAWIWRIAHNKLARFWRQRKVDRGAMTRIGVQPQAITDEEIERIDELLVAEAARGAVEAALAELPPDQQKVIRLRYVEERSDREIAEQLEVTPEVVRARASRGLRRLRAHDRLNESVDEEGR